MKVVCKYLVFYYSRRVAKRGKEERGDLHTYDDKNITMTRRVVI